MLYTRYAFAADLCKGKDVLEVGCGTGQGLGYLAKGSKKVVGGDYTEYLIQRAQDHYKSRIPLLSLDAQTLPFKKVSFDVVILFEALYYLKNPDDFFNECRRVLREKGLILICTVNKEWKDFNPSPYSHRYFSAKELLNLLEKHNFIVSLYGAFPAEKRSLKDNFASLLKQLAVHFNIMPKTMHGKELLKRIVYGKLVPFPSEVQEGEVKYIPPTPILNGFPISNYKILYAVSRNK